MKRTTFLGLKTIDTDEFVEGVVIELRSNGSTFEPMLVEYYLNEYGEKMNEKIRRLDMLSLCNIKGKRNRTAKFKEQLKSITGPIFMSIDFQDYYQSVIEGC